MDGPHLVCEGPAVGEGPVWCPPDPADGTEEGTLVFTSVATGVLSRVWPASGRVEQLADTAGGPNGAVAAADGGFVVTQNGGLDFAAFGMFGYPAPRRITSGLQHVGPGGAVSYLASGVMQQPNDLCVAADGTIFFTDPPGFPVPTPPVGRVMALAPDGALRVVAGGFSYPNGIALEADGETLVVVEVGGPDHPTGFVRLRTDGSREPFAPGRPGDGFALDVDGRIYMAGGGPMVCVYEPDGTLVEQLDLDPPAVTATNCCFGGPDARTLFVTDLGDPCHVVAFTDMPAPGLPMHAWPGPR
ncbi:MAG TPA: SMP-30/gluconolactonase/LRE family protein [Acidimicrobiia bacterium]|nr:SMP-30/gluconolactonase/LRE family protein [Acidimicrobiia bacterium]